MNKWLLISKIGLEYWIKRDDTSSFDLSGNKVRKLEFLLADAIRGSHDCVITIGFNIHLLYGIKS